MSVSITEIKSIVGITSAVTVKDDGHPFRLGGSRIWVNVEITKYLIISLA